MGNGTFRIGMALWGYRGWEGDFYPAGARTQDLLRLYGERMTAVEGNTTFYAVPSADTLRRWAEDLPEGFGVCPKLPRTVTHEARLDLAAAQAFLERVRVLGSRLGTVFAQLPGTFGPERADELTELLDELRARHRPLAVEVRHPAWFEPRAAADLDRRLESLDVGRVVLDTRPIYAHGADLPQERRKPRLPLRATAPARHALVRFVAHPDLERNRVPLREWAERVDGWLREGRDVAWFAHCPEEARSPAVARAFQELLEERGAPVPPLPWNALRAAPEQLELF